MNNPPIKKAIRATLSDIAQHAGVSVSTASLVLANKAAQRRISAGAIQRVQRAAEELDYSPNLLVRSMQRGYTHVLSFFNGFRDRSEHDLYMDMLSTAIERAGGNIGYDILVTCDFRRSAEDTYRYLNGGRTDGMLFFAPQANDSLLPFLRTSRLPVVLINAADQEGILSSVKDDQVMGIGLVAEALISRGHTRIAALTDVSQRNPEAAQRVHLLQKTLAEQGHPIPDRWTLPTFARSGDKIYTPKEALQTLFRDPEPPTALFCWHDRLGYEVLEQCEALGISVPDQLSVIGYDGVQWPAQTSHVLASVHVDLSALAEGAVALLDRLIQGKEQGAVARTLAVSLTPGTTLAMPHL